MKTEELIVKLSNEQSKKTLQPQAYYAYYLVTILIIYIVLVQFYLGLRSDLSSQLLSKSFLLEIFLLASISLSGAISSILSIYPDYYQKKIFIKIPNFLFVTIIVFIAAQLFLPIESLVLITPNSHSIECSIYIAAVAVIPSFLIFNLIRKGAATNLKKAGFFVVLTTTSASCITLRLAENNDPAIHLLVWHYLPTLLFSCLGAIAGKYLLKW